MFSQEDTKSSALQKIAQLASEYDLPAQDVTSAIEEAQNSQKSTPTPLAPLHNLIQ